MSILIICLFLGCLMPIVAKMPVALAMHKLGGYDNNHPRQQQANLTGFGERALAAHQNSFEALITFAPAIVLAIALDRTGSLIQYLAITHIVCRFAYIVCYLKNWSTLRSTVWFVGFLSPLIIIWQCLPV